MKKAFLFIGAILLLASCVKQAENEEPSDKWNGYFEYYKSGEVIHTLYAGRTINAGTVTYGINDNAEFYVLYDCSATGWEITEVHMFAGDKKDMPLNKPGNPKIGKFPYSDCQFGSVSTYLFTVPLTDLPPAEEPGFTVAAHCVVHSPSGQCETGWAEGDYTFRDKGWGWYDVYYFNQPENPYTILYGITYANDSLYLYMIDVTNNITTPIFKELVGGTTGSYDGAAYDDVSGNIFFTNLTTTPAELWVNNLEDGASSVKAGDLIGTPKSGDFNDGSFYYVNDDDTSLYRVNFNVSNWTISSIDFVTAVPNAVTVNDITFDPSGTNLYLVGVIDNATQLIKWEVDTDTFYSTSITLSPGTQIAYGTDGELYAVEEVDGGGSRTLIIDLNTGNLIPIDEGIIIIDDPFSDISGGRTM